MQGCTWSRIKSIFWCSLHLNVKYHNPTDFETSVHSGHIHKGLHAFSLLHVCITGRKHLERLNHHLDYFSSHSWFWISVSTVFWTVQVLYILSVSLQVVKALYKSIVWALHTQCNRICHHMGKIEICKALVQVWNLLQFTLLTSNKTKSIVSHPRKKSHIFFLQCYLLCKEFLWRTWYIMCEIAHRTSSSERKRKKWEYILGLLLIH